MADQAYRGFLIRYSPLRSDCWVEQGGALMWASQPDTATAKRAIDQFLLPGPLSKGETS